MTEYTDIKIIEIPHLFNVDICDSFIREINDNHTNVPFSHTTMFKSNKFVNHRISNYIFKQLKPKINYIQRLNPNVLTAKYNPGQKSHLHIDTPFDDDVKYTLLIYLNDNYSGGETKFYNDDFKLIKTIYPEKGKGLLFDINLFHQGEIVTNGNKYWIGSQVV